MVALDAVFKTEMSALVTSYGRCETAKHGSRYQRHRNCREQALNYQRRIAMCPSLAPFLTFDELDGGNSTLSTGLTHLVVDDAGSATAHGSH